jgi:sterol desaturase/sphingolipid hydroxylase (fatty acid hydroxylase superfamily)
MFAVSGYSATYRLPHAGCPIRRRAADPGIGFFVGVLALMALWEVLAPRRRQAIGRWTRWPSNLGIVVIDTAVLRVLFPITAVGVAILAQDRMHHADLEVDVTTGVRFHPIEIALSMAIKFAVVVALGVPPLAVMIFEVLLNATSMFNHGNVRLPPGLDRVLRWVVVTPEMHRVHHSILRHETDSNFGFNLPWWDWLFGTYLAEPTAGHAGMTFGIAQFRDPAELRLDRMLLQPWRNDPYRPASPVQASGR